MASSTPLRVRSLLPLMAWCLVGCATPPPSTDPIPCSREACSTHCMTLPDPALDERRDAHVLSSTEADHVLERLRAYRMGPKVVQGGRGLVLCEGMGACTRPLDESGREVPAGVWSAHAEVIAPPAGSWTIEYRRSCGYEEAGERVADTFERSIPVPANKDGRAFVMNAIEAFRSPAEIQRDCTITIRSSAQPHILASFDFTLPGPR